MSTSLFVGIYQEMLRAWPNRWLGFFIAIVIAAVAGLIVTVLPDQYQTRAKVYVNSAVVLEPLIEGIASSGSHEGRMRLLRVFQTTLVSKDNVDRLIKTPGMGFDVSTAAARSRAMSIIKSGVKVVEESENLFSIEYLDSNPIRAKNVAQGLLSLFIERYVVDAREELSAAKHFLDKQIAEYQVKLRALESQIAEFQITNVDALGPTTYETKLAAARTARREAQVAKQMAVRARDAIEQQIASGSAGASAMMASDPSLPAAIDRLNALQTQLNTLLLQYTERHPDVIAVRREIALLTEQFGLGDAATAAAQPLMPAQVSPASAVNSAVNSAIDATTPGEGSGQPTPVALPTQAKDRASNGARMRLVQANFAVAEAERKIQMAQAELGIIEQLLQSAPAAAVTLEELNRDHAVVKDNLEQLLKRRESAIMRTAADLTAGAEQFRIIVSPSVPDQPSGPDRRTFLMLGSMFAVVAGAGIAYALGLLRGTFVSAAEAEHTLGLPVIARLTNRQSVMSRVSQSADTMMLLGCIAALFVATFILSAATDLLTPLRTEIYRLLETTFGL